VLSSIRRRGPGKVQSGAALLEALVAMLVLAVGVVGLLAAQMRSMSENRTANHRQLALRLADDLKERMTTNPLGWAAVNPYVVGWGAPPAAGMNCAVNACTGPEKAAWDLVQWKQRVGNSLPQGQATTFISPSDPRQLGVMIAWVANERSTAADHLAPFNVNVSDGATVVNCPAGLICHLTYLQPR
jgi:type IV pilus assembly protein PilV